MGNASATSAAVAAIAAMIAPALLILGSASLVASALLRMARIVDRARFLNSIAYDGTWEQLGTTRGQLASWLRRHDRRARYAETSIALLYGAIVVFVATCLSIAFVRAIGELLAWLPPALAVLGTTFLLAGGALMVLESRSSGAQIAEEISNALSHLQKVSS